MYLCRTQNVVELSGTCPNTRHLAMQSLCVKRKDLSGRAQRPQRVLASVLRRSRLSGIVRGSPLVEREAAERQHI